MKILIKYPSRGRPELFKETSKKFIDKLSGKHEVKFVFSFDTDDVKMNNFNVISYVQSLPVEKKINFSENQNKVQAINADLDGEEFDILVLIQDDLIPIIDGYDDLIAQFFQNSEFGTDCMLHFQTARWADGLDIYCIMGKKYYERFNYIYYPEYKGLFCDNEYTEVSKLLNRNIFISGVDPFLHNHIEGDETELKNRSYGRDDWELLESRKKINYGIIVDNETEVQSEEKIDVNFIITCYDKELYYPFIKSIISSYKKIVPHIALSYNGEKNNLNFDFDYCFRTKYLPNGGRGSDRHPHGCDYADADYELTIGGYDCLKDNGVTNWVKLSIDSWLIDENKIIQIFTQLKNQNCTYAGNYWYQHKNLSTDIFFANTEKNNIFEDMKLHGKEFFDYLYEVKNPEGFEFFMGFISNQYDKLIIQDREPLNPNDTRWFVNNLGWTMSHVLDTNINFVNNYRINSDKVQFKKVDGIGRPFSLEENKQHI